MPKRASNPVPLSLPPHGLSGEPLTRWIIDAATRQEADGGLGFTLAGVCPVAPPPPQDAGLLTTWLAEGQHAQMDYMRAQAGPRFDPSSLLLGALSILMVADQYHPRDGGIDSQAAREQDGTPRGRVARYARGRDYHQTIKRRLHRLADTLREAYPGHDCRTFTDTAPVLERRAAQQAGLGWLGKNAMLIHPQHGSYLLLGGFLTTLHLPALTEQLTLTDHCGTCTRCIDACPTQAIAAQPLMTGDKPRVDGSRCISYLTIEHEGPIPAPLASRTGDWVFGCDICQEVCPHNSPRPGEPPVIRSEYAPTKATIPLLEALQWQAPDRALLTVSAMKRATAEMFRRNAANALNNNHP